MRLLLVLTGLVTAACSRPDVPPPEPPAPLHHVVLFTLKDPADAAALLSDCATVGALPGARGASAGPRLDVGRAEADATWHVAFHVAFADATAYAAWRDHPRHREVIAAWAPKIASISVHDWTDATP